MAAFFTIGHSNRGLDAFIGLLVESKIERVIDVRAFPRSRTNPQFNIDTLPAALTRHGIAAPGRIDPAVPNAGAEFHAGGSIIYPGAPTLFD